MQREAFHDRASREPSSHPSLRADEGEERQVSRLGRTPRTPLSFDHKDFGRLVAVDSDTLALAVWMRIFGLPGGTVMRPSGVTVSRGAVIRRLRV